MSEEKVMQSLLLDYSKAIETTQTMATAIEELNKQLSNIQGTAKTTEKNVSDSFGGSGTAGVTSEVIKSAHAVDTIVDKMREFGIVTTRTATDAEGELSKLTVSAKDLKQHLETIASFKANDGILQQVGSVVVDTREMEQYKAMDKLHTEALKMNTVFDDVQRKNKELVNNSFVKQYVEDLSKTTPEMKHLNKYFSDMEKSGKVVHAEAMKMNKEYDKEINSIKQSTLAKLDGQAASIQQRVVTKGISDEYSEQAKEIRSQIALLQEKLEISGKLSLEEAKQAKELQEKTKELQGQVQAASAEKTASGGILESEFQRRLGWFFTGSVTFGAINAIKEAVSTFKEVEMGVTEIARVMNDSSFVFKEYRDNLLALGVEYGQTFDVVQNIALRWAQSGYSTADSLELARTSLLALNTAELDARNATESMIGIMAQWQLEAGEMELVMDKINKTADNYTITSQDLVDGLLRSSGAARVMNVSLDETIGLLTVMREASGRTGREVGNALNSILSYIQRPSAINTFERLGINVFADEAKTQFRNAMEIFGEIAVNWGSLSADIQDGFVQSAMDAELFNEELAEALGMQEEWNSLQQRDVTQAAAGIYRRNYFIGMIERMSNVQGVLNGLMTAEGYSMRENERTMNTLEKQTQSLSASMEMLAVAMGDAGVLDLMKQMAAGGANLAMMLAKLPPELRDMVFGFGTLMTMMTAVQAGAKMMHKDFDLLGLTFSTLGTKWKDLTDAIGGGLTKLATNPLTWIALAIAGAVALYNHYQKAKAEQEAFIAVTQDNIISLNQEKESLTALSKEYETLKNKQDNLTANADERERLLKIQYELVEQYGVAASGIDIEGRAFTDSISAIERRIEALNKMEESERKALRTALESGRIKDEKTIAKGTEDLDFLNTRITALEKEIGDLEDAISAGGIAEFVSSGIKWSFDTSTEEGLKSAERFVSALYNTLKEVQGEAGVIGKEIEETAGKYSEHLINYSMEVANAMTAEGKIVTEQSRLFAVAMADAMAYEAGSIRHREEMLEAAIRSFPVERLSDLSKQYEQAFAAGDARGVENASKDIMKLAAAHIQGKERAQEFIDAIARQFPPTMEEAARVTYNLESGLKALGDAYQLISGDVKNLNQTIDSLNKGESLSGETILSLMDKYDGLSEHITKTTDGYTIEISVLENLRQGQIDTATTIADEQQKAAEKAVNYSRIRLKTYGIEVEALGVLQEMAQRTLARLSSVQILSGISGYTSEQGVDKKIKDALAEADKYNAAIKQLEKLQAEASMKASILSDRSFGVSGDKGSSGSGGKQESELARAYKLLEHHKKITEDSVELAQWELNELKEIQKKYGDIMTEDERMTMIEKLYAAEKRLNDMRAKATEESLKQEQNAFSQREDYIKHWTTLGIININQQIEKYKELYTITAKSAAEEMKRTENLFSLYKKQLTEQKNAIKSAYDDRINQIKEQAELEKKVHQDKIAGIEKELALLSEEESDYDYERKMADLYEELAYWQVRVSEDARKKEAETIKKIEDAKYKREMELKKKGLEDTKKVANDEIRAIDDAAKAETEKWKAAYDTTMDYFDDHAISIIATAELMGERAFDAMQRTYFEPMKRALRESSVEDFSVVGGSFGSGITDMGQVQSTKRGEIKSLAQSILALKKQWTDGDKSAATRATSLYEKLSGLDPTVANMLHQMDYLTAREYVNNLPEMHTGGKTLSYGAVYMKPGELVFPPNLSMKLEGLMNFLERNPVYSDKKTNNEEVKQVIVNGNLFNSEKTVFNDEVDMAIMSRELQRSLLNM